MTTATATLSPGPAPDRDARLIDRGTLSLEASIAGRSERYGRGKTSHTIHVWWARRPHGAMRALVFASLMPDTPDAESVLRELPFASAVTAATVKQARGLLHSQYPDAPKVLDVFGGGGTIAYEAAVLGAKASSLDYNNLSVFIQKANLDLSQQALTRMSLVDLVKLTKQSGTRVLDQTRERTRDLFPLREPSNQKGTFAYFWSYRFPCVGCHYEFLLLKRPWLSRKQGRKTRLLLVDGTQRQTIRIDDSSEAEEFRSPCWTGRNGTAKCPKCGKEYKNPSILESADALLAVGKLLPKGKSFTYAPENAIPSADYLRDREQQFLQARNVQLPSSRPPKWSGIVNSSLYGIDTHNDFFNRRQRLVLLELIAALADELERLGRTHPAEVARFVTSSLSALIDQLVDWNCRLSMWISQNEQVGRAFCGPGVPMLWDYVESDPVSSGPANLWHKLDRIVAGVAATPSFDQRPDIRRGCAQRLPFASETFDAVITDPPYYDNLYYSVLADFFYAWKRPLLQTLFPDLFDPRQSDDKAELVASQFRHGDHASAHAWYCSELTASLREIARVLKPTGILSFVFAHGSLSGWEAIVRCFRNSGIHLTSAHPLSIERRERPRAMTSEAVNTCIVLVGRKSEGPGQRIDLPHLKTTITDLARTVVPRLKECGWPERDLGMAVFAGGVVKIANSAGVNGTESDATALNYLSKIVRSIVPGFKIQDRQSL